MRRAPPAPPAGFCRRPPPSLPPSGLPRSLRLPPSRQLTLSRNGAAEKPPPASPRQASAAGPQGRCIDGASEQSTCQSELCRLVTSALTLGSHHAGQWPAPRPEPIAGQFNRVSIGKYQRKGRRMQKYGDDHDSRGSPRNVQKRCLKRLPDDLKALFLRRELV